MKKTFIAALLAATSLSALASDYYVVVPLPNRSATAGNILVTLNGYTLPTGVVGRSYAGFDFNSVLQVRGDPGYSPGSVRWSVASGVLPAGLALSSDGRLTGAPTAAATSSFQVLAAYKSKAGQQNYQVMVADVSVALAADASMPAGVQGAQYSYDLKSHLTVAGDPQYTPAQVVWSVASGSLPSGLQLNANGTIIGVPDAEGTYPFTIKASYLNKAGQQSYQVIVGAISVGLTGATIPVMTAGTAMTYDLKQNLSVAGDAGYAGDGAGVTWSVDGALPSGLTLGDDGRLTGTPTAVGASTLSVTAAYKNKTSPAAAYNMQVQANIVTTGSTRTWSDGTYAASCKAYRNPTGSYVYSGSTGDGTYRIKPGSTALDVYCDQTTDGGGWTLVNKADWKGMIPRTAGVGTSTVCSSLTDACLTNGTSNMYIGTASLPKDYMFLQSANGFARIHDSQFLLHNPGNYIRNNVTAPGHSLYSLMTDATAGWADPADTASDPSDQNKYVFADTTGAAWSDGNWHGCPANNGYCAPQNQSYPYQQGLQVMPATGENSGLEQRWGQHHFTGEPTLSSGLYTLQPYTYLGVAGSPNVYSGTRTVPQATFDAYRWAVFVR